MNIYLKIKHLRDSLKLSQVDFAKEIGISRGVLSQIELENQKPTIDTIKKIAINYNIPYDYFFDDDVSLNDTTNSIQKDNKPPGININCLELNKTLAATEKALEFAESALKQAKSEIESRKETNLLLTDKVRDLEDRLSKFESPQEGQKRRRA